MLPVSVSLDFVELSVETPYAHIHILFSCCSRPATDKCISAYTTSTEVIAQIMAHDSMLACDRPTQGTPAIVKALATAQKSQLVCVNPVCGRTEHLIKDCFKPGGGKEGQYPDWWKKKGTATASNTQKANPTVNIATTDSTTGSSNGDGEFYALVTSA